jgi:hypothetical protein
MKPSDLAITGRAGGMTSGCLRRGKRELDVRVRVQSVENCFNGTSKSSQQEEYTTMP